MLKKLLSFLKEIFIEFYLPTCWALIILSVGHAVPYFQTEGKGTLLYIAFIIGMIGIYVGGAIKYQSLRSEIDHLVHMFASRVIEYEFKRIENKNEN